MRITPLDIRNHAFQRKLSGYDRNEVSGFLRMVADDYEAVLHEVQKLRQTVAQLESRVGDLASNESILKDTLTTAQRLGEELRRTAIKESEVLVSEAEIRGEKILDAAHRRAAPLAEDIREMKNLRARVASSVRAALETHLNLLSSLEEAPADNPELDGKVAYLTRRPRESRSAAKE
ncbi:MAG: DivIVA domain-containing protein [Myxococcales bacterium]|nr:DivIVA domain-containing protein [Myxococcales bacterium]